MSSADAFDAADGSLETCAGHLDRCRADHAGLGKLHDRLGSLQEQMRSAATDGNLDKIRSLAEGLGNTLTETKRSHRSLRDGHDAISRSLDAAKLAVQGARDAASVNEIVTANPTGTMGAQVSSGQSPNGNEPRSLDPEVNRRRDQLANCRHAHDTHLGHMGIRR